MAQVTDYTVSNQTFPNTRADINNIFAAIATNNSGTSAPSNQQAGQWWIDTTSSTWVLYIHDGTDDIQFATIDTSANTVNFTDSALDVVTDTTPQLGGNLDLNSNDITGTGNINITGNITASGNLAGTLTTASQPNITSVGTLTSATVSGDLTVDTDTLYVDSADNRVGIGTTGPSTLLDVSKNDATQFSSSGDQRSINCLTLRNANETQYTFAGISLYAGAGTGADWTIANVRQANYEGDLLFKTRTGPSGFAEKIRVKNSGDVLVGKTSTDQTVAGTTLFANGKLAPTVDSDTVIYANRETNDGDIIDLRKDGTTVGTIGSSGGDLIVGTGDTYVRFSDGVDTLLPVTNTGGDRDNAMDLGYSTVRFRHLYLGGSVYLGGTTSANALDDYEEGTWTPTAWGSGSINVSSGRYVKIGNVVTITAEVYYNTTSSSDAAGFQNLPFTVANAESARSGNVALSDYGSGFYAITLKNSTRVAYFTLSAGGLLNSNFSGKTVYFSASYYIS